MNNERIDLTEDGLRKQIIEYAEEYLYPTSDVDMGDVENILHCINSIGLIAELKRCYKLLDDADYAMSRYGEEEEHQDIDNVADAYEAVTCALAGMGRHC